MKKFDDIFKIYSEEVPARDEDGGHKPNQVGEKYAEISEATGLDNRLLRVDYTKETIPVDERLKRVSIRTGYVIPDDSVRFVVDLLKKHTSSDYQSIRRADFSDASGKELKEIVDGFTAMLRQLGYPCTVIVEQKRIMEKRFHLKSHLALEKIQEECQNLIKQAESYVDGSVNMNADDEDCFLQYMASSLAGFGDYMARVHEAYADTRSDELYDLASVEAENINMEEIALDCQVAEAINADEELQEWIRKRNEIIGYYDFVKNKRKEFNAINERINERIQEHHMAVYGTKEADAETRMFLRHPIDVLYESIVYVEDDMPEMQEDRCKRLVKTREQIKLESEEAKRMLARFDEEVRKRKGGR